MARGAQRRSGVTLLELMLALALTGVVITLIGMAIELNLRTLESGRREVERSQLARAILRQIAADLQNAVLYEPLDMSGVPSAGSASDMSALGVDESMTDLLDETDLGLDSEMTESTLDIAGTATPASVPGLFGNQYELQVDVSRLPRVDQYQQVMVAGGEGATVDIPSDVKTVAYFLQLGALDGSLTTGEVSSDVPSGLMRRQLDRAVTAWAAQNGGLDTSSTSGEVLAPEVNYLEFRYFDGLEWATEWDSQSMGGLPVAVEITIGMDPAYGLDPASAEAARALEVAVLDTTEFTYRLVVRLPTARPVLLGDESMEVLGL